MKTLLILLLACGLAMAQDCAERPRLTVTPDALGIRIGWASMCQLWMVEASFDNVEWFPASGIEKNMACNVTNGHQTNCIWWIIEPTATRQQFYRLRLAPGH